MNQKPIVFGALLAVVLLLVAAIWYLSSGGANDSAQPVALPDHKFENWDSPIEDPEGLSREAESMFDGVEVLSYEQLIIAARKGQVSLVSELWKLRRQCPDDMDRYDCNIRIRQFIMDKFLPPGNEQLAELFTKYLKYEEEMSRFEMPKDLTLKQQYELIRDKRRDFFGPEDAQLVFGFEEAKAGFTAQLKSFQESTAGMSGDARIAAYEEMRKKAYGDYYETVVAREPKFSKYETELQLRETDLTGLDPAKRGAKVTEMREKYFGKEGAARMAKVDAEIAERETKLTAYKDAEAELLKNNAELSGDALDGKLMELRIKHFGKEEAEAYARRENYEKAMKELRESRNK
ncbi:MAG: lipase chaperone [bacterium]|nr:lipase chaperone [bacterium]